VYLNASDSILVFAGTQDGTKQLSSQTFTIQATEPYTVLAYEAIAPPAISPLMMQWSESKALYIGGSETNTKAMVFSPSKSWVDSNATLADPIYNTSNIKAVLINGDDGSKNIYTFDNTVSPNGVNRTVLIDGDGNPVQNAMPIESRSDERWVLDERGTQREKRGNLTVSGWPSYNDTLAPTTIRTKPTLAQDQSGLVVISGGNEQDVLCIFKARDNCWVNATATLGAKSVAQQGIGNGPAIPLGTSTSGTVPGATQTQSSTSTPAAAAGNNGAYFPVKILGAVLGSILAIALILVAILSILRCRAKRRRFSEAGHQRRSSGYPPDEKENMDFVDRGLPQMSSTRQFPHHEQQASHNSFSSMAILMGRVGHKRGGEKGDGSFGSGSSSQFNKYKTPISNPIPLEQPYGSTPSPVRVAKGISFHEEPIPVTRPRQSRGTRGSGTRRSSGWNRYWSGGSALNVLGFTSKRTTFEEGSERDSGSHYSEPNPRLPSQATQRSAMVPPLKIGEQLNQVASGSPTVSYQANKYPMDGVTGSIERSGSVSSAASSLYDDRHDAFSSGVPESVQDSWTPVQAGRGVSNYSASVYTTTNPPRDTMNTNYQRDTRFQIPTTIPRPGENHTSDMSWLNLGAERRI
jgi:hypothetical protein